MWGYYRVNKAKTKHSKSTHRVHYHSFSQRTKEYHSGFSAFRFYILGSSLFNTLHSRCTIRGGISDPRSLFIHHVFALSLSFKIDLSEFNAPKPQIKFQNLWGWLYLPRICVFCVQFKEIVPRIVWPEEYVFCGLSRMILIFSIFSSLGGDWRGSDVGVVVVVATVVVVAAAGSTLGVTVVISLELWLILQIENDLN